MIVTAAAARLPVGGRVAAPAAARAATFGRAIDGALDDRSSNGLGRPAAPVQTAARAPRPASDVTAPEPVADAMASALVLLATLTGPTGEAGLPAKPGMASPSDTAPAAADPAAHAAKPAPSMNTTSDDRLADDADAGADDGAGQSPEPAATDVGGSQAAPGATAPVPAAEGAANGMVLLAAFIGQAGTAAQGKQPIKPQTARPDQSTPAAAGSALPVLAGVERRSAAALTLDGGADKPARGDAPPVPAADAAAFGQIAAGFARSSDRPTTATAVGGGAAAPPTEVAITHHLDLAKDGAWLDRLAKDIAASADPSGHLRFSLAPERLGRLDVALAQGADGTTIRLTTETREAQRIVADAQPQLIAEARAQGLRVSETSVDLNNSGGGNAQAQAFGNQNARGEGQQQPHRAAPWQPPVAQASVTPPTETARGGDELYA